MTTGNSHLQTDIRRVEAEAREWFMLRGERGLSGDEQSAFDEWMQQVHNRGAYQRLEQIDRSLAALAAGAEGARLRQPGGLSGWLDKLNNYFGIAPVAGLAFACTLILAVGVVYLAPWQAEPGPQAYAAELAQQRTVTLDDGSRVTLGGDSAIEVAFSDTRRSVKLLRGQAFFEVSRDPARPFYVGARDAEIRVVGTRFDVHAGSTLHPATKVTVEEGIVDVASRPAGEAAVSQSGPKVRLVAGQQVRVEQSRLSHVTTVDSTQVASWRQGKFSYRDAPLSEVVADANRYRQKRIVIGTRELENLRVTTAFTADQADTLVAMLEQSLPVRVFKEPDGRVVIWPGTVED